MTSDRSEICGVVCNCGPAGEPLACGYAPHDATKAHSWATLPTFPLDMSEFRHEIRAAFGRYSREIQKSPFGGSLAAAHAAEIIRDES